VFNGTANACLHCDGRPPCQFGSGRPCIDNKWVGKPLHPIRPAPVFSSQTGTGNNRAGLCIAAAIILTSSGKETSCWSEIIHVFPAAPGCSRHTIKKSTRLSMPTRLRELATAPRGKGRPSCTIFIS